MSLYSSEEDIITRRDYQLNTIMQSVNIQRSNTESSQLILNKYQEEIDSYKEKEKKPPLSLINKHTKLKNDIESRQSIINEKMAEYKKLSDKFDRDLARYRYIKSQ